VDFTRLMPNYFKSDAVDDGSPLTDEELAEIKRERHKHAPKHGPQRVRWITAGQQRRQAMRDALAQQRKANRRYRRQWMANEAAFQTLLSQVRLVDDPERGSSPLADGVRRHLDRAYGSVDEAREHLAVLVQERVEARRSQVGAA
jgi:hypothetical protein